jgi:hypothetical protein
MAAGVLSAVSHYRNQRPETTMTIELMEQPLVTNKVGSSK